jgi:hypothetical protein
MPPPGPAPPRASGALKGLAAGADLDVTATVTVPCGLDAGPYFLSAVVDSGGVVAELVEHNNGLTASTRVDVALWRPGLLSVVTGDSCQLTGRSPRAERCNGRGRVGQRSGATAEGARRARKS